jgi:hypothetical protein
MKNVFFKQKKTKITNKTASVDNKRDYAPCFKNTVTFIVAQIYKQ